MSYYDGWDDVNHYREYLAGKRPEPGLNPLPNPVEPAPDMLWFLSWYEKQEIGRAHV